MSPLSTKHPWPLSGQVPRSWILIGALVTICLAVVVLLFLLVLTGGEDPTWERIIETGVVLVCTDPSWLPFEVVDGRTGQIEGFDIDLAKLMAQRLAPGVQAQFVSVGFDSLYDALLAGRCDMVVSALPYDPLLVEDVAYSMAYFNGGPILAVREDTAEIEGLEDLAGRVVGIEWGFALEGAGRQRSLIQNLGPRRYDTAQDALRALQIGEVDAVLVDHISALAYQRDCPGLRIVGEPIYDLNYVIPVRPDSFQLLEELNRALLEMREDGTLEQLQARWF